MEKTSSNEVEVAEEANEKAKKKKEEF